MASDKITVTHTLFPLSLLSLVVVVFLGFQTTLLVNDSESLKQLRTQQTKPLEQVEKIKTQVNSLAIGTLKLSEQGNKDAAMIIAQLKKAGIDVTDSSAPPASPPMTGNMPGMPMENMPKGSK